MAVIIVCCWGALRRTDLAQLLSAGHGALTLALCRRLGREQDGQHANNRGGLARARRPVVWHARHVEEGSRGGVTRCARVAEAAVSTRGSNLQGRWCQGCAPNSEKHVPCRSDTRRVECVCLCASPDPAARATLRRNSIERSGRVRRRRGRGDGPLDEAHTPRAVRAGVQRRALRGVVILVQHGLTKRARGQATKPAGIRP